MVVWLVLGRPNSLRDRQPPFLGVVEFGIDIENNTAERKHAVADDLADLVFGGTDTSHAVRLQGSPAPSKQVTPSQGNCQSDRQPNYRANR